MRKWYSLIDKVYAYDKLHESFQNVKRNKGSRTCGVDGVSISMYAENLEMNLSKLSECLKNGDYSPKPVKRVYIDKEDGSQRGLGVPTIEDRIVQQSLKSVLEPIYEPHFHPSSYGYRPNRSSQRAVAKAERFINQYDREYVVDMDLSKCFDTLNHDQLIETVNQRVSDGNVLKLIRKILTAGVVIDGVFHPTDVGSPQGGIISPLLMNIYLDRFDQYMMNKAIRIVRYADDILIFGQSKSEAGKYQCIAEKFLESDLKLKVNRKKTHLTHVSNGVKYLGFVIRSYGVGIQSKKIENFKEKVKELTPRNMGNSVVAYISKLNSLLRGFTNYFKIARAKREFSKLMSWIRRRLRMMIMKSWKSWKPLHKILRSNGYKGSFQKISVVRWKNSNSPLISMALPNQWFEEQGLFQMDKVTVNTLHQYYENSLA